MKTQPLAVLSFFEKCPPVVVRVVATALTVAATTFITIQFQHVTDLELRIEQLLQEKYELQVILSTERAQHHYSK